MKAPWDYEPGTHTLSDVLPHEKNSIARKVRDYCREYRKIMGRDTQPPLIVSWHKNGDLFVGYIVVQEHAKVPKFTPPKSWPIERFVAQAEDVQFVCSDTEITRLRQVVFKANKQRKAQGLKVLTVSHENGFAHVRQRKRPTASEWVRSVVASYTAPVALEYSSRTVAPIVSMMGISFGIRRIEGRDYLVKK